MPRYVIERDIPGAGQLSTDELKAIAQKSCSVLDAMGTAKEIRMQMGNKASEV